MSKYEALITQFLHGGALGLVGFSIGLMTSNVKKITLAVSLKYAFVAIISGAAALSFADQSPYGEGSVKYYTAIFAGWSFFFIIKGLTVVLERFSTRPFKTIAVLFSALIELLTAWRKK